MFKGELVCNGDIHFVEIKKSQKRLADWAFAQITRVIYFKIKLSIKIPVEDVEIRPLNIEIEREIDRERTN